jgi:murein DD-endopeptidase MepM/ murein hydrolase activator NlpD
MPVARPSGRLTRRTTVAVATVGAALLVSQVVASGSSTPLSAPAGQVTVSGMLEASDAAARDPESPDATSDLVLAASVKPLLRARSVSATVVTPAAATVTATALASTGATSARPLWARMPALALGSTGAAVTIVQKKLRVKTTGFYGPMTQGAVRRFQARHALPPVGKVGPQTWKALLSTWAKAGAKASPAAAPRSAPRPAPAPSGPRAPVVSGRICPAPGAAFGQGWGAQRAGHLHQGMDLMASRGTPILAIEDGVVIREGRQSNGALRIVLQGSSGAKFYYGHMMKDLVHAGTRVKRGQVIGLMGDSGSPGAVHLHFEYWPSGRESAAVNPAALLTRLC